MTGPAGLVRPCDFAMDDAGTGIGVEVDVNVGQE